MSDQFYILSKDGQIGMPYEGDDHWERICKDSNRIVADEDVDGAGINVWTYFVGQGPYCMWETAATQDGADPYWAFDWCMGDRDDAMEMHKEMVERVILSKRPERPTIKVRVNPETGLFEERDD